MDQPDQPAVTGATPGASPAARSAEVQTDLAGLAAVATELDGVEAALARIDDGSYGRCTTCGTAIDTGALEEDPLLLACPAHR